MKVPYNYLPLEFKNHKRIFNEWKKLIKSSDFTLGNYVNQFEKKFAKYIGSFFPLIKGCSTNCPVLKPIFSALAIASSVVPVLLQSSLNLINFEFLTNCLLKE